MSLHIRPRRLGNSVQRLFTVTLLGLALALSLTNGPARAQLTGPYETSGETDEASVATSNGLEGLVHVSATLGYTGYALDEAVTIHNDIVSVYRSLNIPVPTQKAFPNWFTLGGGLTFDVNETMRLGGEVYYSSTAAYSRYRDFAGSLDVQSEVTVIALHPVLEVHPAADIVAGISPLLYLQPGVYFVSYANTQHIDSEDLGLSGRQSLVEGEGRAFGGELGAGLNIPLFDRLSASVRAGYRVSRLKTMNIRIVAEGERTRSGEGELIQNLDGFMMRLTVGVTL